MIFSCKNIQKSFGIDVVLNDISFLIEENEKAAIVGVNGAGKTTLLKIITGELQKDGGEITLKKGAQIGYLSQMMGLCSENTVEKELESVFDAVIKIENELRELEKAMSHADANSLDAMMEKYARLSDQFENTNGYERESRLWGVIKGLGFSAEDAARKISTFSGGQKTKVALGKLLLTAPDLLLLDEPTNHLDIESVQWLEDVFIKNYEGSVIIVSHDRYFLDKTVTKIIEIENGKAEVYNGNYSYYSIKKENDRAIKLKHYVDQQREIKRQEDIIKRLKSFNREKSIRAAESKEKRLAKMEKVEKPEDLPDKIWIVLEPRKQSGNDVLFVNNLSKSFEKDEELFKNISFEIKRGEKIALIGANGIGKTTLIRMIMSSENYEKNIKFGVNVEIGYFDQEHQTLDESKTIFNEISDSFPYLKNLEIRNTLAAFVFYGDDVYKPISSLSGGEKGRVALAKLMLSNANFLILDEPTNHLDIYSKEILEEALRGYMGTILYISHDRYFINNTADKVIEMESDGATQYLGNYDYYTEKRIENKRNDTELENEGKNSNGSAKNDWILKKEAASKERQKQATIEKLENNIALIESKIKELDDCLEREEINTDAEKAHIIFQEKTELEENLIDLYEKWHDLSL